MGKQLISIIIPTRNRQEYAEKTIRQVSRLDHSIQIIVQDNSDNDSLKYMIEDLVKTNRIDYAYEKKPLSFSANYNEAAERATGKYICAIGDDDGVLPTIVDCAKWMEKEGIDAVKPAKDLVYCYPGNKNKRLNACVGFDRYSGNYRITNPETAVIALLNNGGCNYLELDLVGSYHGLVSMRMMDKVKEITGVYYGGLTPDMYSVVCLSLIQNIHFAVIDYPITLPGVCPTSGSAASETGKHVGRLEDAPHLKHYSNYHWDERIPRYYSVETIWAETLLKAVCEMNREELIEKYFNRLALAYYLYKNNIHKKKEILEVLEPDSKKYVMDTYRPEIKRNNYYRKANRVALRLTKKRIVYHHIEDIEKAVELVMKHLQRDNAITPWVI